MPAPDTYSPADTYRRVNVTSGIANADPHELIAMLMQGVLDSLAQAIGFIEAQPSTPAHIARKGEEIGRAISIIETLRSCLDHDAGAEITQNLDRLYEYMSLRLLMANAGNKVEWMEEVSALMREIKSGWDEIPQEARALRKAEDVARIEGSSQVLGTC